MVMCSTDRPSTVMTVESIASRATEAMREGRALVQPLFLSGEVLDAARSDMQSTSSSRHLPQGMPSSPSRRA